MALASLRGLPPAVFEPVLGPLKQDMERQFDVAGLRLQPLAYEDRPFSHILLVALAPEGDGPPRAHVFVKVFKLRPDGDVEAMRKRVSQDFAMTKAINDRMREWPGLGVVRPLACYVEHLAVVTERAEGDTLLELLDRRARWFPSRGTRRQLASRLEAVGRWLKAFQSDTEEGRVSLADLEDYVDIRLRRLVGHQILTELRRQEILQHLRHLGGQVPPPDLRQVALHADLALGNVLVSGNGIVVLDFTMATRGSHLHDISRLYMQMDILPAKPSFRRFVIRDLQGALLRGLDPTLVPERPLFRLLSLLHRINHFGTLSLQREGFASSVMSSRVRRLHLGWLEAELRGKGAAVRA